MSSPCRKHRKDAAFNDPVLLFLDITFGRPEYPASMQVCIPSNWATSEVVKHANKHEALTTKYKFPAGWQWGLYLRPTLTPDDILVRVDCPEYPNHEHVMLKSTCKEIAREQSRP